MRKRRQYASFNNRTWLTRRIIPAATFFSFKKHLMELKQPLSAELPVSTLSGPSPMAVDFSEIFFLIFWFRGTMRDFLAPFLTFFKFFFVCVSCSLLLFFFLLRWWSWNVISSPKDSFTLSNSVWARLIAMIAIAIYRLLFGRSK